MGLCTEVGAWFRAGDICFNGPNCRYARISLLCGVIEQGTLTICSTSSLAALPSTISSISATSTTRTVRVAGAIPAGRAVVATVLCHDRSCQFGKSVCGGGKEKKREKCSSRWALEGGTNDLATLSSRFPGDIAEPKERRLSKAAGLHRLLSLVATNSRVRQHLADTRPPCCYSSLPEAV